MFLEKQWKKNRVRYADPIIKDSIKLLKNDLINNQVVYSKPEDFHFINVSDEGKAYINYVKNEILIFFRFT